MRMIHLCSFLFVYFHSRCGQSSSQTFGEDEVIEFRDDIRDLFFSQAGINSDSVLNDALDILFDFELPLLGSSIRLAFHDCSGEFPPKCDGCIDPSNRDNRGIFNASINPLRSICNQYKQDYGLSIADCWALTSTFAIELSSELTISDWTTINEFYDGNLNSNDFPSQVMKPGDIPYYIGRIDCDTTPQTKENVTEEFPNPTTTWTQLQDYFGTRFDMTKKEIAALLVGGHSIGRGRRLTSGWIGPWDVSPNTLDNEYAKALLGENRLPEGFSFNWGPQERIVEDAGPRQFFVTNPDFIQFGDPFTIDRAFLMLPADISIAFNRSFYITSEPGPPPPALCSTNAIDYCAQNFPLSIVLYPGESEDDYPSGTEFCEQIQCPLQCVGGETELNMYVSADYSNLDDNYDGCPVAWVKQFADDNDELINTFISAYTTLITGGYVPVPANWGSSSSSSSSDDEFVPEDGVSYIYEIDIDYDDLSSSSSS